MKRFTIYYDLIVIQPTVGIRAFSHFGIGPGLVIEPRHYVEKATLADVQVKYSWSTDPTWTYLGHRANKKVDNLIIVICYFF